MRAVMSKEERKEFEGALENLYGWVGCSGAKPAFVAQSKSAHGGLVMGRAKAHIEAFGCELQDVKTDNL